MLFYTHLHYLNNGGRVPIAKANKRISAPYSIWKILAHAQYYVKLARVLFSRDFFCNKTKHAEKTPFLPQFSFKNAEFRHYSIGKILAHARFFFAKKQIDCKGSRQKNRRISASYSILKILAHAQYYVKLARVLFSRDFFLQTNKVIVRTATHHLENKTEIGKGRLCRKKTQFSAATYFLVVVHTTSLVLQQHYQTQWSQTLAKKAKWVLCNELRNVFYVQFCKERHILIFFIWYFIKSFGPIFEDGVECALCRPLQFRGSYCWIIWFLTMPTKVWIL